MHKQPKKDVASTAALPLKWIAEALSPELGDILQVETVKVRPWSQVYRVIAEQGISYFKICGPDAQHEGALLEWLLPEYAAIAPEVIALSPEQGWILMADAGIPWRDLPQPAAHRPDLQSLLSRYAQLQQHSLDHIDTLLAMPLPDRRLERLPQLVQDLIATGDANGWFDPDLSTQVLATLPTLEQLYRNLSVSPYAAALDHGDLHAGNVLVEGDRLRICDWGDACITHPFCSLLPLVATAMADQFASVGELVKSDLINHYLQTWWPFAPSHVLKVEMQQALCLGLLLRSIDIAYMLQRADAESIKRWSPCVSKFLVRWVHIAATIPKSDLK